HEAHHDAREEHQDREDRIQEKRNYRTDDRPTNRRERGVGSLNLLTHVSHLVELGRDPVGLVLLPFPAGHRAVGSRGAFKNLRSSTRVVLALGDKPLEISNDYAARFAIVSNVCRAQPCWAPSSRGGSFPRSNHSTTERSFDPRRRGLRSTSGLLWND